MKRMLLLVAVAVLAAVAFGCGTTVVHTRVVTRASAPAPGQPAAAPPLHETDSQQARPPPPGMRQFAPGPTRSQCGIERWAVKTLTDPAAGDVSPTPVDATIAQLTARPAPLEPTARVPGIETTIWRVTGARALAFKQEADGDIHLEIADAQGRTMIAEFPDASCDATSAVKARIDAARQAFVRRFGQPTGRYQPISGQLTLVGVGFFDRIHGQLGVAPNGVELHPVLDLPGSP